MEISLRTHIVSWHAAFCPQVMEAHMRGNLQLLAPGGVGIMSGYQTPPMSLLPQTNLPQNLPLVQNLPPQNFSIKDQHLLKPPPFMHAGKCIAGFSLFWEVSVYHKKLSYLFKFLRCISRWSFIVECPLNLWSITLNPWRLWCRWSSQRFFS